MVESAKILILFILRLSGSYFYTKTTDIERENTNGKQALCSRHTACNKKRIKSIPKWDKVALAGANMALQAYRKQLKEA